MVKQPRQKTSPRMRARWQRRFLAMLPTIEQQARRQLRRIRGDDREELLAEAVALAYCMFIGLAKRGKINLAYATPLATYGAQQALVGRRAGTPMNVNDVTSYHCQRRKRIHVHRLDRFDVRKGEWREAIIEDRRTPVPDQAAFRCDFPAWLTTLSLRRRCIAETLAAGEGTSATAERFQLTPARISQLRRELRNAWLEFHGETVGAEDAGCREPQHEDECRKVKAIACTT